MSYAPSLRAIRAVFDLRQRELATWLGLSLSQVALIETDRNPLPGHALPWLLVWLPLLSQPEATLVAQRQASPKLPTPPDIPTVGPAPVLVRLIECRYQRWRLALQLQAQQVRIGILRARLAAGPALQAALPPAPPDEPAHTPAALRRRWLARLLEATTDELTLAVPAETLLAARCHAWRSEDEWLRTYLAAPPAAL